MTTKRGAANIARFNQQRTDAKLPLVVQELALCKKRKLEFRSEGLLASYLADRIPIDRTTLVRNPTYRLLILDYLKLQPGAIALLSDKTLDPTVLQAKLIQARLDLSNSEQKRKQAEAQLHRRRIESPIESEYSDTAFSDIAMLLVEVLTRLEGTMTVNFSNRCVEELAAKPSMRLVSGPVRSRKFVSWLERNRDMSPVKELLDSMGKMK